MKKIMLFGVVAAIALTGCKKDSSNDAAQQMLAQQEAIAQATREELESAIAERDELLDIINGINSSIAEIQNVEHIVSINQAGEGKKAALSSDLAAIKTTLADRRKRLADLEAKLKDSKLSNSKMLQTVETLKAQIDQQTAQIEELTANLENANRKIADLGNQVDSLSTTVTTVTDQRDQAQTEAARQADLANECFYAIGTKKQLKEHNIVESGFLRKTRVMPEDFDKSYFVKADKRTLRSIPLNAKKAKVVSASQPANSYEIVDYNGSKVLNILNPTEFWGVSNFVVIQID